MNAPRAEINTDIIQSIANAELSDGSKRFILVGSIGRGVLLGNDSLELTDPKGRRFLDVDVIDRSGVLRTKYLYREGCIDTQPTRSIRPLEPGSDIWGLFDKHIPNENPLSTFPEAALGLTENHFSSSHPDKTIPIPVGTSLVALSDIYRYSNNMAKHLDQFDALAPEGSTIDPTLADALDIYNTQMEIRYPAVGYARIRRTLFKTMPWLALSIQEGSLGNLIRTIRMTTPAELDTLDTIETVLPH